MIDAMSQHDLANCVEDELRENRRQEGLVKFTTLLPSIVTPLTHLCQAISLGASNGYHHLWIIE